MVSDRESAALPLSALLSQTLVAFTIEFDNEAERQLHARTDARPFLVSLVMWYNCLRYLGQESITPEQLVRRARTQTNLAGMQRWRYLEQDEQGAIRATKLGRLARRIWVPLSGATEARWSERFGSTTIAELRAALGAIVAELAPTLPDCLPILHYGLRTTPSRPLAVDAAQPCDDLPALLARILCAFALDFEARSELSLALAVDVLRVFRDDAIRLRDLPHLSGVSKEAIAMEAVSWRRAGYSSLGRSRRSAASAFVCPQPAFARSADLLETSERSNARGSSASAPSVSRACGPMRCARPARWGRLAFGARLGTGFRRLAGGGPVCGANRPSAARSERRVAAFSDGAAPRRLARRKRTRNGPPLSSTAAALRVPARE